MKKTVITLLLVFSAVALYSQDSMDAEKEAIKKTALNYLEGWYEANVERMDQALYTDLVKRVMRQLPNGKQYLNTVSKSNMLAFTENGGGSKTPEEERNIQIKILDVSPATASVKTICKDYIDYLHLAKIDGEWKIINVLWERNQ